MKNQILLLPPEKDNVKLKKNKTHTRDNTDKMSKTEVYKAFRERK